ncbi:hypothetical protein, partial [Amycolatopsis echigonensis]
APQRRQRTASTDEHREVPVSNPAEIAGYSDASSGIENSFVELGADDTAGIADSFDDGDASQIELDAA